MKICPKCRHQNEDSMNFCLECGSPLPSLVVFNSDEQLTQVRQVAPPTNFGSNREVETIVAKNQNVFGANFQQATPPPRKSNMKAFLIVGGIASLLLLFAIAGAAVIGYNAMITDNKPTPSPTSTRPTPPNYDPTPTYSPKTVFSTTPDPSTDSDSKGSAVFNGMRVDFNKIQGNKNGMLIHVDFKVLNLKSTDCYLLISFQNSDGVQLPARSDNYKGPNGQAATYLLLTPGFDDTIYKDLTVFMPYDELNTGKGKFNLKMDVDVVDKNGKKIEHLNIYPFQYEQK